MLAVRQKVPSGFAAEQDKSGCEIPTCGNVKAQYFAKTVEVIFKRSNHRPPFAFSRVLPREAILLSSPINSREEREAAKSGARVLPIPL
jgi:hypothetical protein